MSRKYHKTFISNNGNNFYLQFHIKDWMRVLPAFINYPNSRKNYKESLRTSDYNLAYERANKRLKELQIIERPKMGFGVPIDNWLRGSLKDWAESLLNETRLRNEGYFDQNHIRTIWEEHISMKKNWHHHLWDILMFQSWLDKEKNS